MVASAAAAAAVGGGFGGFFVAVGDDEDAEDGEGDGEHFVEAEFVVEEHDAEDVGEEGGAVVDRGQVGGGGHVYGDVPGAAGDGEEGCHKCSCFEHVAPGTSGGDLGV